MPPVQGDSNTDGWTISKPTALLALADGVILEGYGFGAVGVAVGEVCFNTAMTGYEGILTDPSYAGQIVTFTFPHIGNVGTNEEDIETVNLAATPGARGVIVRADVTDPSNFRATRRLDAWLQARGIIGLCGLDTRALTARIRQDHMRTPSSPMIPRARFDRDDLLAKAAAWPGIDGMDLVPEVHVDAALRMGRNELDARSGLRQARAEQIPRRRHRLGIEAQHIAPVVRLRLQGLGGARNYFG